MSENLRLRMRGIDRLLFGSMQRVWTQMVLSGDLIRQDKPRAHEFAREEICLHLARALLEVLEFTEGPARGGGADFSDREIRAEVYVMRPADYQHLVNQIALLHKEIEDAA